jgi:CRP-like cAMP-binding protein
MHPVIRKLSRFTEFSAEERAAVELVFTNTFDKPAHADIVREDEAPGGVIFLVDGFVSRSKILADGRTQVIGFILPGGACDIGVSVLERRDHGLTALIHSRLARVSDDALEHLMTQYPRIRAAMHWAALQAEAIAREWIVNVGQRNAASRMAHLFCELYTLLDALGLTDGRSFALPLTQEKLSETLGISSVHVNRTLQKLRHDKLISFGDQRLTILDLDALQKIAGFDPLYLHLDARYHGPPCRSQGVV